MDRIFLDANVLFSAAYRKDAGVRLFWSLDRVELITSAYAVEEARRNLSTSEQQRALDGLLKNVTVINQESAVIKLPEDLVLPSKDEPIMMAAMNAKCTHLITGDIRHFGAYFGKQIAGILILKPASYLKR